MSDVELRGIDQAVEKAGGQRPLGEALGVSKQAVSRMVQRGFAPPARAIEIEALYGIPRQKLLSRKLVDLFAPTFGE